ncbi:MAG: 3'-5' exonuclease [Elusimicrobia bacterium]|nr:3'-5' exonuclease [Elusimicrobiota bacterium]
MVQPGARLVVQAGPALFRARAPAAAPAALRGLAGRLLPGGRAPGPQEPGEGERSPGGLRPVDRVPRKPGPGAALREGAQAVSGIPRAKAPEFVAIDFETADHGADSACAVGLVRVSGGKIVGRERRLLKPPRRTFVFTSIHGITWEQVRGEPSFGELWPALAPFLEGADFLAAHNAPFDRRVLNACCGAAGLEPPPQPFVCTVRLSRKRWSLPSNSLPNVCRHLGLSLNHHEALSDAEACAGIVLAALADGAEL